MIFRFPILSLKLFFPSCFGNVNRDTPKIPRCSKMMLAAERVVVGEFGGGMMVQMKG